MTWEQAGQICFDQVPLIARHLPLDYWRGQMDWQHRVQMLFADEQRLKPEIDAAMREFSVSRTLSKPPAGILNFLTCCRFECACDTTNILLAADSIHRLVPDPSGVADDVILGWLLVETWNEWRWDSFLKLEALRSLSGSDSFYGSPSLPSYAN
jgi:hypothetical protein